MIHPNPASATPIKILLADDDEHDRYFFEKAIKDLNRPCHFHSVIDGEKLMNYLTEKSAELPDILFLDLNMPRKSGYECLVEIKGNEKLRDIPVIIYTTSFHHVVADKLYELGAHYYLRKPNFVQLKEYILHIIGLLAASAAQPDKEKFSINFDKL